MVLVGHIVWMGLGLVGLMGLKGLKGLIGMMGFGRSGLGTEN
jgi:hypothetical protein